MYLNNSYLMLVTFVKYCHQKITNPKSIKDNLIGSVIAVSIVFSIILIFLRFFG